MDSVNPAVLVMVCMVCVIVGGAAVLLVIKYYREHPGGSGGSGGSDGGMVLRRGPSSSSSGGSVAMRLGDFGSIDDSLVFPKGKAEEIQNITDLGNGTFQFLLRHRGSWYDGDRDGRNNAKGLNKSRAEATGPGKSHQVANETWEYGTTFSAAKDFIPSSGFCNIFQLFPVAWLRITGLSGDTLSGALYHNTSDNDFSQSPPVREFKVKRGEWISFVIRAKVHASSGELTMSVGGDAFKGKTGFRLFSNKRKDFGSKFGLYMSTTSATKQPLNDSTVWHRNVWARKV